MLDLSRLEKKVCALYGQGLAQSTSKAYAASKRRYTDFCRSAKVNPLPITEHVMCLFVAHLAEAGLQPASVRSYLSAARHLQISAGLPDPTMMSSFPRLAYVLKGMKRSCATSKPQRQRLPITPQIFSLLLSTWNVTPVPYAHHLLRAACCIGFFGFLRAGEFTAHSPNDVDEHIIAAGDVTRDSTYPPVFRTHSAPPVKNGPLWPGGGHLPGTNCSPDLPGGCFPNLPSCAPEPTWPTFPLPGWLCPHP